MKQEQSIYKGIIVALVMLVGVSPYWGCSHTPTQSTTQVVVPDSDPAQEVISKAEQLFHAAAYEQAGKVFRTYLFRYPDGNNADLAMLRLGDISNQLDDPYAAQTYYQRLVTDYPQSPWYEQAYTHLVELVMLNQDTETAIAVATDYLDDDLPPVLRRSLWQQLARLYRSQGNNAETAKYSYFLYGSAAEEEKEQWFRQVTILIEQLDTAEIDSLWPTFKDDYIRSFLMFRCAMLFVMDGNDDDALDVLMAFQARYPEHPRWFEAEQFVASIAHVRSFEPLTVGCLLPLSGDYAVLGNRALNAIEMAMSRMPSGETAPQIKIIIKDTASMDSRAVQGVRELADARVAAIIGPIVTAADAAREAQQLGIPMVAFTQKTAIPEIGNYIFQHFITPNNQVNTLIDYLSQELGLHRYAVMYPDESYGKAFLDLFWTAAIQKGGVITGIEAYDPKATDFAETIQKLVGNYYRLPKDLQSSPVVFVEEDPYYPDRLDSLEPLSGLFPDPLIRLSGLYAQEIYSERKEGSGITFRANESQGPEPIIDFDALFIPEEPKKVGLILPHLAFFDVRDVYLVGTNLWHSDQLLDMSKEFAQSAIMVDGFFNESHSKVVQAFVEAYRTLFQREPGIIEAFAFDTANLVFNLLEQQNIRFLPDMRLALQQSLTVKGGHRSAIFRR